MSSSAATEVAIIGGSFAGLSAAINLLRARRAVTLFDSGVTRNRFAAHAHGFLGQDGATPEAIRLTGRTEILAYPTLRLVEDRVETARKTKDGFHLQTAASGEVMATHLILAFGMTDSLPLVEGLAACWGRSAFQCPYCHGYEEQDRPTAILMTSPMSLHHAFMLGDWTDDLVLLTNGHAVDPATRTRLAARDVRVVDGHVTRIEADAGQMSAVVTADGTVIPRQVLYLQSTAHPSCDLAEQVGCAMTEGPFGPFVTVDAMQQTSVPQVWAAGDLTRAAYGSVFAAADGVRAGTAAHRSLMGF